MRLCSLFIEYIRCYGHCSLNTFAVVVFAPSIHLLSCSLFIEHICCCGHTYCSLHTFAVIYIVP